MQSAKSPARSRTRPNTLRRRRPSRSRQMVPPTKTSIPKATRGWCTAGPPASSRDRCMRPLREGHHCHYGDRLRLLYRRRGCQVELQELFEDAFVGHVRAPGGVSCGHRVGGEDGGVQLRVGVAEPGRHLVAELREPPLLWRPGSWAPRPYRIRTGLSPAPARRHNVQNHALRSDDQAAGDSFTERYCGGHGSLPTCLSNSWTKSRPSRNFSASSLPTTPWTAALKSA